MSKMGQELERRLDENKYKMWEALIEMRDGAVLQAEDNSFYILRLSYASWRNTCKLLAKVGGK